MPGSATFPHLPRGCAKCLPGTTCCRAAPECRAPNQIARHSSPWSSQDLFEQSYSDPGLPRLHRECSVNCFLLFFVRADTMRAPALLFAALSSFAGAQPHTGYSRPSDSPLPRGWLRLPLAPLSVCRIFTHMARAAGVATQRSEHHGVLPGGVPGPLQPAATS